MNKSRKIEGADGVNIIAQWPRNASEMIRVSLTEYRGRDLVDIRIWYLDENGKYKPGRSGITLSVSHLPLLAKSLRKALKNAIEFGRLPNGFGGKRAGGQDA